MRVFVRPRYGLCNRMRVIASIFDGIKDVRGKMTVFWEVNNDLYCQSSNLFSLPKSITVINEEPNGGILKKIRNKVDKIMCSIICSCKYNDLDICRARLEGGLKARNMAYYDTCQPLDPDFGKYDYSIFEPVPKIKYKAEQRYNMISENGKYRVIGMHIRRTDNDLAIQKSESDLFCEIIDSYTKRFGCDKIRFYIASDSVYERKYFTQKYNNGGKALVFFSDSDVLDRNTVNGIEEAYTELVTLSMTERVYGSFWSSYSVLAAALSKIPYDDVSCDSIEQLLRDIDNELV